MTTKSDLRHTINDLMSDLNNLELGISALIRQGLTSDARDLQYAKNVIATRLRDARRTYSEAQ